MNGLEVNNELLEGLCELLTAYLNDGRRRM